MDSGNLVLLVLGVSALAVVAYLIYKNRAIKGKVEVGPFKAKLESKDAVAVTKAKPEQINANTSAPTKPLTSTRKRIDGNDVTRITLPKINAHSPSAGSVINAVQRLMDEHGEINTKALRIFIAERFSMEEMAQLCADLNIDFESIAGETKEGKALELVQYCARRGLLHELTAAVIDARA